MSYVYVVFIANGFFGSTVYGIYTNRQLAEQTARTINACRGNSDASWQRFELDARMPWVIPWRAEVDCNGALVTVEAVQLFSEDVIEKLCYRDACCLDAPKVEVGVVSFYGYGMTRDEAIEDACKSREFIQSGPHKLPWMRRLGIQESWGHIW